MAKKGSYLGGGSIINTGIKKSNPKSESQWPFSPINPTSTAKFNNEYLGDRKNPKKKKFSPGVKTLSNKKIKNKKIYSWTNEGLDIQKTGKIKVIEKKGKSNEGRVNKEELKKLLSEADRRIDLYKEINREDPAHVTPSYLRKKNIYNGAQGIYMDKLNTRSLSNNEHGVTVSLLHTGDYYPDELSDDGVIYHYPNTIRANGARDKAEIEATKNCHSLNIPLFVILEGKTSKTRKVKLGWVLDFDDDAKIFLVSFDKSIPNFVRIKKNDPFNLTGKQSGKLTKTKARPNQQKFRFECFVNYGSKCGVCSLTHPKLLEAAHIRSKEFNGSDDWRNGMILCRNHHTAFDKNLFRVLPSSYEIICDDKNLLLTEKKLNHLKNYPHIDALKWKYKHKKT